MVFMTSQSLSLKYCQAHQIIVPCKNSPNKHSPKDTAEEHCTLSSLQDTKHVEILNRKINLEAAWL